MKTPICAALAAVFTSSAFAAEDKCPNILFAFADDWGRYASAYAKAVGAGTLNDVLDTPHFDRVAGKGALFLNCFVTAPSCTPCRRSLLSGQYLFRTGLGAILQGAVWDESIPTFPHLLGDAGNHMGETYKVWVPGTPRDAGYGGGNWAYEKAGMCLFDKVPSVGECKRPKRK